jgi:hypothetical protein
MLMVIMIGNEENGGTTCTGVTGHISDHGSMEKVEFGGYICMPDGVAGHLLGATGATSWCHLQGCKRAGMAMATRSIESIIDA